MVKKQTKKQSESDSARYEIMPSEQVLLDLHQALVNEYASRRNLAGMRKFLSQDVTAIGSAPGEYWTNQDDLIAALKSEIERIPRELVLFNQSFRVERLNDACAIVWGYFSVRGKTSDGTPFENQDCQLTAVYCLKDGKPLACHLHGSQLQRNVATANEPWPLHALLARQHETAEKYRFILDNAPVGIMQYDLDGYLKDYNAKFLKIFGTTAEKLAGISLYDLSTNRPEKRCSQLSKAVPAIMKAITGRLPSTR